MITSNSDDRREPTPAEVLHRQIDTLGAHAVGLRLRAKELERDADGLDRLAMRMRRQLASFTVPHPDSYSARRKQL